MNKSKFLHNRKRELPVCILCLVVILIRPSLSSGQERFDEICNDPDTHHRFVNASAMRVRHGVDVEKVLNTLDCIAMAEPANRRAGGTIVIEALFHVAKDNSLIQEHLLRIIAKKGIDYSSLGTASGLIVYVIDESGIEQLRKLVEADSPVGTPLCYSSERCGSALGVLVEVGDVKILPLLERFLKDLPPEMEPGRWLFELYVKKIRVQRSVGEMLRHLETGHHEHEPHIFRGWLVRQAMRHGATREQVRAAACSYMRKNRPSVKLHHSQLIRACEEYKLFTASDVAEFEAIRKLRESDASLVLEFGGIGWATEIDAKRAAFYKIPYTLPEPGQRTAADPRRRPPYDWQK